MFLGKADPRSAAASRAFRHTRPCMLLVNDTHDNNSSKFPVPIYEWNSKGIDLDLSNPKLSDEQRKRLQRNIDIMRDSIVR